MILRGTTGDENGPLPLRIHSEGLGLFQSSLRGISRFVAGHISVRSLLCRDDKAGP